MKQLLILCLLLAACQPTGIKNIIILIGDGMGPLASTK